MGCPEGPPDRQGSVPRFRGTVPQTTAGVAVEVTRRGPWSSGGCCAQNQGVNALDFSGYRAPRHPKEPPKDRAHPAQAIAPWPPGIVGSERVGYSERGISPSGELRTKQECAIPPTAAVRRRVSRPSKPARQFSFDWPSQNGPTLKGAAPHSGDPFPPPQTPRPSLPHPLTGRVTRS